MTLEEDKALRAIQETLDHFYVRLKKLNGEDRIALINEFKEWLADDELREKVWFSIKKDNK